MKYLFLALFFLPQMLLAQDAGNTLVYPDEAHFKNIRQLTFGGDNAEAYFGFDNEHIVYQRTDASKGIPCDQIFFGSVKQRCDSPGGFCPRMVSTGKGRTTCAFLMPGNKSFLYASTHEGSEECPPVPDRSVLKKYIWPIYPSFDIYEADFNGRIIRKLTDQPGYDAEATVSPRGDKIVFTSMRTGDLELFTMNIDGSDVRQITHDLGYDGGAWFSPDGSKIIWRASRPKTDAEIKEYKELLAQGMVAPTQMEVFVANADGTDARQVTKLGQANWAPNFTPDGKHIIFSSNHEYKRGFPFNIYLMDLDGSNMRKISHDGGFDAFPAFSPDGKKIIFSSNRNNGGGHATNLFIADWQP